MPITVDDAVNIVNSVDGAGGSDLLDSTVGYRLARFRDRANSMVKAFNSVRNRLIEKYKPLIEAAKLDEDKLALKKERDDKISKIRTLKENINTPEFKLSDFTAQDEIRLRDGVVVKKGQMLVPQYFLTTMVAYIKDDVTTDKNKEISEISLEEMYENAIAEQTQDEKAVVPLN